MSETDAMTEELWTWVDKTNPVPPKPWEVYTYLLFGSRESAQEDANRAAWWSGRPASDFQLMRARCTPFEVAE